MAGSLQLFGYFFDSDLNPTDGYKGVVLRLDESNQRALGNHPGPIKVGDKPANILRFTPRYLYWEGKNPNNETIRRKIVVCNPANFFYQHGGSLSLEIYPGTIVQGYITGTVGETKTFVPRTSSSGPLVPRDTGITDYTQP